jgi:hypothetical protein
MGGISPGDANHRPGNINPNVTMKSVSDLGLAPGKAVYAVIKVSNVMNGSGGISPSNSFGKFHPPVKWQPPALQ